MYGTAVDTNDMEVRILSEKVEKVRCLFAKFNGITCLYLSVTQAFPIYFNYKSYLFLVSKLVNIRSHKLYADVSEISHVLVLYCPNQRSHGSWKPDVVSVDILVGGKTRGS